MNERTIDTETQDDIAEVVSIHPSVRELPHRDLDREREESVAAFRGLAYAMLFSIPTWAVVGFITWAVIGVITWLVVH